MPRINKRIIKGSSRNNNNNKRRKNNARLNYNNNNYNNSKLIIDETDKKIIELLISNMIMILSQKLHIPLSTIQRRIRKLFEKEPLAVLIY